MHQNTNRAISGFTNGFIYDSVEADPAPASPIQSALSDIHGEQSRTNDLLDNLFSRLSRVLDHNNKADAAGGPQAVPPSASPLHGEMAVIAERQRDANQRIAELLNRITL